MGNEYDKTALSLFIKKKRKHAEMEIAKPNIDKVALPWYKRPLIKDEFIYRVGKDKKYYIKHKEWGDRIWIGPYKDTKEVEEIIDSYVVESLKNTLDKKVNSKVHSIVVEDEERFF